MLNYFKQHFQSLPLRAVGDSNRTMVHPASGPVLYHLSYTKNVPKICPKTQLYTKHVTCGTMTDLTVAYLTMKSQSSVSCLTLRMCVYPGCAQVCPSSFRANQVHPNLEGCAKRWGANGRLRLRSPANGKKWSRGSWLVQARARGIWAERRGSYWTVRLQMNTSGQWKRSPLPVLPPYKTAGALWQLILEKYLQSYQV